MSFLFFFTLYVFIRRAGGVGGRGRVSDFAQRGNMLVGISRITLVRQRRFIGLMRKSMKRY